MTATSLIRTASPSLSVIPVAPVAKQVELCGTPVDASILVSVAVEVIVRLRLDELHRSLNDTAVVWYGTLIQNSPCPVVGTAAQ